MSAVDLRTVRQLATEHILDHARRGADVAADVMGHFGPGALEREVFDAWYEAICEAVKTATLVVGWPNADLADGMPAGRVWAWTDATRQLPADQHTPMPLDILGDLVAVVNEQLVLVDHLVECPSLAADPYGLAACRVCGCTDTAACVGGCSWVPDPWQSGDLCSACLPADPASTTKQPSGGEAAAYVATFCRRWVGNPTGHVFGAAIAELVPNLEALLAERGQRDEDVRAVDAVIRARADGKPGAFRAAVRELGIRFAERITDVRQRDRAGVSLADRIAEQEAQDERELADRIAELQQRDAEGPVSTG